MYMQVLDPTTIAGTYTIKYEALTPAAGDAKETFFKLTLVNGPAPANYQPTCITCASSTDTLTIISGAVETD
jgi:hypothetical protein